MIKSAKLPFLIKSAYVCFRERMMRSKSLQKPKHSFDDVISAFPFPQYYSNSNKNKNSNRSNNSNNYNNIKQNGNSCDIDVLVSLKNGTGDNINCDNNNNNNNNNKSNNSSNPHNGTMSHKEMNDSLNYYNKECDEVVDLNGGGNPYVCYSSSNHTVATPSLTDTTSNV